MFLTSRLAPLETRKMAIDALLFFSVLLVMMAFGGRGGGGGGRRRVGGKWVEWGAKLNNRNVHNYMQ